MSNNKETSKVEIIENHRANNPAILPAFSASVQKNNQEITMDDIVNEIKHFPTLFQQNLSAPLPIVLNNVDFNEYAGLLNRIDAILGSTGIDFNFANEFLAQEILTLLSKNGSQYKITSKKKEKIFQKGLVGFRCMIAMTLRNDSLRDFSVHLAESAVLQRFCLISQIGCIVSPSKSELQRFSQIFPTEMVQNQINELLMAATRNTINLETPLETKDIYVDATCLMANIHFPVDWLLLRDGMRTLLEAIIVIRQHGLLHRMKSPQEFLRMINNICIRMSLAGRKKDSKKARKKIFRELKSMSKIIMKHGHTYYDILAAEWATRTDLTEGQVQQILARIDNVLEKLPSAIKQAHSRIISGLVVDNKDKILSLYDDSVRVIVRKKAGAEVEFGNTLFIAEQANGVILDWHLYRASAPSDQNMLEPCLHRLTDLNCFIESVTGDRGFDSAKNGKMLNEKNIFNGLAPKNPQELIERLGDPNFKSRQNRRAQTEGRIGILKNNFIGSPIKNRKFEYKEVTVAWAVLTHNLWVVARLPQAADQAVSQAA